MTIAVKTTHFSGTSKVFSRDKDNLAAIVRGLAIDNAIKALEVSGVVVLTDSTTGTASTAVPLVVGAGGAGVIAPSGVFSALTVNGVGYSAFNTSLGKIRNAQATVANVINTALGRLGITAISFSEGSDGSGTVAALDLAATGQQTTSAVNYASYVAAANAVISNQDALVLAFNKVLAAVGWPQIVNNIVGPNYGSASKIPLTSLTVIPAVVADGTGAVSVLLADGTLLLQQVANNFATMIKAWNGAMYQTNAIGALSNSTGGTSTFPTLAQVTVTPLAGYTDVSQASAAASSLNTLFGVYQNGFSSLWAKLNLFAERYGMPPLVDLSGGAVSTTLATETISPTAGGGVVQATTVFTQTSTNNLLATDTFQVGNSTFNIVATIGTTPGNVLKGASWTATMANIIASLAASIAGTGATANYIPLATAANNTGVATSGTVITFTAIPSGTAGNALASVYTASGTSAGSFGAALFAGGLNASAGSLTTINAAVATLTNNISTVAAYYNTLHGDAVAFVDSSGGVANPSLALSAIPSVVVADNTVNAVGVTNASVITVLTAARADMATLLAGVNLLTGTFTGVSLHVVASPF